jgi:hypothetical protein
VTYRLDHEPSKRSDSITHTAIAPTVKMVDYKKIEKIPKFPKKTFPRTFNNTQIQKFDRQINLPIFLTWYFDIAGVSTRKPDILLEIL